MTQDSGITAVAHVIQLSVAPVFLLSGIGAMLAVMMNRLASHRPGQGPGIESPQRSRRAHAINQELDALSWRARHISRAITCARSPLSSFAE